MFDVNTLRFVLKLFGLGFVMALRFDEICICVFS